MAELLPNALWLLEAPVFSDALVLNKRVDLG